MYHCFSNKLIIARKQHKCIWCGEKIEPGFEYMRQRSVFDGVFQNHAWHPECNDDFIEEGDTEFTAYSAERPPAKETPA